MGEPARKRNDYFERATNTSQMESLITTDELVGALDARGMMVSPPLRVLGRLGPRACGARSQYASDLTRCALPDQGGEPAIVYLHGFSWGPIWDGALRSASSGFRTTTGIERMMEEGLQSFQDSAVLLKQNAVGVSQRP